MMPNCTPSVVFRPPGTSPWLGLGSFRVLMMRMPSTARSMMVGQFSLVLAGACQFGHGAGGFTINFIHSGSYDAGFNAPNLVGAQRAPKETGGFLLVFWVLAGACQRHDAGVFCVA